MKRCRDQAAFRLSLLQYQFHRATSFAIAGNQCTVKSKRTKVGQATPGQRTSGGANRRAAGEGASRPPWGQAQHDTPAGDAISGAIAIAERSEDQNSGQSSKLSISRHARTQAFVGSSPIKIADSAQRRRNKPTSGLFS